MDKAAVYELEKKGKRPLFGAYYYDWPDWSTMERTSRGCFCDDADDESEFDLERIQEFHEFNR